MESTQTQQEAMLTDELNNTIIGKYTWIGPVISVSYLIVIKLLHKYMENKPAYELKSVLRIYNLIQVWACTKHVLMSFQPGWWWSFKSEHCTPNYYVDDFYKQVINMSIVYCFLKIFDIFDTIFIVLKKKSNQLTFLHMFHHSSIITVAAFGIWDKEVLLAPCILLNSLVHIFMYSYYFVASFSSQKWIINYKKYITQLQLTQFVLALTFLLYAILAGCQWKRNSIIFVNILLLVITYEFAKFYLNQYIKKKKAN